MTTYDGTPRSLLQNKITCRNETFRSFQMSRALSKRLGKKVSIIVGEIPNTLNTGDGDPIDCYAIGYDVKSTQVSGTVVGYIEYNSGFNSHTTHNDKFIIKSPAISDADLKEITHAMGNHYVDSYGPHYLPTSIHI